MKQKNELWDELESISPILAKMKGEREGFQVPKDYFKSLPDEVLGKLGQNASAPSPSWLERLLRPLQSIWEPKYVLATASALAILVVAVCFFKKPPAKLEALPVAAIQAADIPDDALHAYLADNIEDIDEELIVEAKFDGKEPQTKTSIVPQPSPEELDEYLNEVIDEIDPEDLEDFF
jgi:hypothetical protein